MAKKLPLLLGVLVIVVVLMVIGSKKKTEEVVIVKKKETVGCPCVFCQSAALTQFQRCIQLPNQDSIEVALKFASLPEDQHKLLSGKCESREYIYQTLEESRRRILKMYTQLALDELNHRSQVLFGHQAPYSPTGEARMMKAYHFAFVEFISASASVDRKGNSRWRVDIMVEEQQLRLSLRLVLDFTIEIECHGCSEKILTCAEYTTFPFPRYFGGYPALEQTIPLPSEVIVTGRDILSRKGVDADWPNLKGLFLNRVWSQNSNLALGTELPETLFHNVDAAKNDTSLETSAYPQKRITPPDVKFPEQRYARAIETVGAAVNTDIWNDYLMKPRNQEKGDPENKYHYQGSSETYDQSMVPPIWPNGWIAPAEWYNRWPRLWSEPRDRMAWPSVGSDFVWDSLGVLTPTAKEDSTHPGVRSSTEQEPRTPNYWPTLTGLPLNAGPNDWLFGNMRGGQAVDAAKFPTR